jgi:hypothetical protein
MSSGNRGVDRDQVLVRASGNPVPLMRQKMRFAVLGIFVPKRSKPWVPAAAGRPSTSI